MYHTILFMASIGQSTTILSEFLFFSKYCLK